MRRRVPAGVREVLLIVGLFLIYKLGRVFTAEQVEVALDYAGEVWAIERRLHLPSEALLQQALLPHESVVQAANAYYAWAHFPVTGAVLLWAWFRDRSAYLWVRRLMALLTFGALLIHVVAPLAPPRMVSTLGFVDTGQVYGQSVYGPESAFAGVANQLAAMPSLHVGWAAIVALAVVSISGSRWRFLALAHPIVTALVVVVTANHWWLDGIIALAILAVSVAVLDPGRQGRQVAGFRSRAEVALT